MMLIILSEASGRLAKCQLQAESAHGRDARYPRPVLLSITI